MTLRVTRDDLRVLLDLWASAGIDADGVCGWVAGYWPEGGARFPDEEAGGLSVAREVVAELDLLPVHLITVEDVPALLRALDARPGEGARAVEELRRYREAIDRRARSRALRRIPLYRPFCL